MIPRLLYLMLSLLPSSWGSLHLPRFFGDGMVLQQAPKRANVYGRTDDQEQAVLVQLVCKSGTVGQYQGNPVRQNLVMFHLKLST